LKAVEFVRVLQRGVGAGQIARRDASPRRANGAMNLCTRPTATPRHISARRRIAGLHAIAEQHQLSDGVARIEL